MNATFPDLYALAPQREEGAGPWRNARLSWFAGRWETFLEKRRTELSEPIPDGAAASGQMHAHAFAFVLTGASPFADRAADLAQAIAADPTPWMSSGGKAHYPALNADLISATRCLEMAVTLGWIGETLTPDKRRRFAGTLAQQGRILYDDTMRGAWWGDALNSNWTSHLLHGLGAAGLALGESAWIAMATDRMQRMLDLAGEEGAGIEGIGYFSFCYSSVLRYATALKNVRGDDLLSHSFWGKCALFPLYHTLPDLSGRTPTGDSSYPGLDGGVLLAGVARVARDGIAQWQTHRILEASASRALDPYELIYYDPTVAETSPETLPPCRIFRSVQLASFRSGWDRDAVYLLFHGGSNTWSHCHLDLNGFTLDAYGERLAIDHGSWGYTPAYFSVVEPQISTAWHNTLVVDGADQRQAPRFRMSYDPKEGGDCYATLEDSLACDGFAMVRGDATSAYADQLDRFWREIVYLKPDRFVIYDNVRVNGARVQRHLQWLLHSAVPMQQNGDRVEVRGKRAKLLIEPIFPTGWRARFPDRLARAHAYGDPTVREAYALSLFPPWLHLWNESPENPAYPSWEARGGRTLYGPDYPFLVVLTPTRIDDPLDWTLKPLQTDGVDGVRIHDGEKIDTLLFRRHGGPYALGEIESDADKAVVRVEGDNVTSSAIVRGTYLRYRGRTLLSFPTTTSAACDQAVA